MEGFSICIPVYNWDITQLVNDLEEQAQRQALPYEIVVADDCSTSLKETNKSFLADIPSTRFIELSQNVGRAKIRNLLAQEAKYDTLIFMDSDMKVCDSNYIANYMSHADKDIVVGGAKFQDEKPAKEFMLRWTYGKKIEYKPAKERSLNPNKSFMTLNFMIKKKIFEKIKFEETFTKYGHEDTVMGWELENKGIKICHIDNPMMHLGLDTTEVFMDKTGQAIDNLVDLYLNPETPKRLTESINLLRFHDKAQRWGIAYITGWAARLANRLIMANLRSWNPSMPLFQLYKYGMFMKKLEYKKKATL